VPLWHPHPPLLHGRVTGDCEQTTKYKQGYFDWGFPVKWRHGRINVKEIKMKKKITANGN
jgi:hypothetical protein